MLSDAKPADGDATWEAAGAAEGRDPSAWAFGSRLARRNIAIGRRAYRRYAEAAELALNTFDASSARASEHLRAAAREMRERFRMPDQEECDALARHAARGRANLRAVALRAQIAIDTNVEACFASAEKLAQASSLQDCVTVQASFVLDQWQRSLRQMLDLQRMTAGLLRKASPTGAA